MHVIPFCFLVRHISHPFYFSWFGGTQMEASSARKVLPCFDEPGFKTTFDVNIAHDKAMTAISNMPETDTHPM